MFGYDGGMAREYSPQEKAEAVAVALTSRTLDDARSALAELWNAPPPAKGSLSIWMRDPNIQPDAWLLNRIEQERKALRAGRLHQIFDIASARLVREVETMSWGQLVQAMTALGINWDKHEPKDRRSAFTAIQQNFRGPTVIQPWAVMELPDGSERPTPQ